jgi:16S rRNA (guanine527-N7)-methyltransferase
MSEVPESGPGGSCRFVTKCTRPRFPLQIREKLAKRAAKAGLALPEASISGLEAYFELLRKWNRRLSLTALPVEEVGDEAVDRLLVEPAIAAKYLPSRDASVIDIGSGGGSPAIPMKLVVPGLSLLMVESKTRKAAFLREAIRHLGLDRTDVESSRFEELLSRPLLHDSVDVVTLRAVKVEPKSLAAIQSFVKPLGLIFLFTTESNRDVPSTPHLAGIGSHLLLNQFGTKLKILRKTARA